MVMLCGLVGILVGVDVDVIDALNGIEVSLLE